MSSSLLPPVVDSHCHLDFEDFDLDLDQVVKRAETAGVSIIVTICTKPENLQKVLKIVKKFPNIYFAAGSHPLNTKAQDWFTREQLLELTTNSKMIGIGETGLDYFYSAKNANEQKRHFRLHINLARECALPLIVHSRSADKDMIAILSDELKRGPFDCVLHCFSSGMELAQLAVKSGFYLSISGIAVFSKSVNLRHILSQVPLNRILIETDSPYLAPPPFRGKRNEPSYVALTARIMAKHLGVSEITFRTITTENFSELFKKIKT